ncbi:MAG: prolipoprotein diacylglyceryl transferase [Candidatus Curtissbacteria bacterium]|nr:prolipoprotein diacylglyceryl transferase [Candidatus Curtissbacteria bacterium]
MLATLANFPGLLNLAVILLSVFVAVFLFWRAGRHELIDSELLLDTVIVAFIGGLAGGRLWDFIVRPDMYHFSLTRLIFFNAYPGIDFAGVLLGFCLAVFVFLRGRKVKFFEIFDLAVTAIAFGQSITFLGRFAISFLSPKKIDFPSFYFALGYFIIFWILKRFGKRKRHPGFFACFYLFAASLLEIAMFFVNNDKTTLGSVPYKLTLGIGLLVFSLVLWHTCSGRSLKADIKWVTAAVLLSVFKFKRTLVSVEESGNLARFVILSPYYLAKKILKIIKFIGSEIISGLHDFLVVLGVKKFR